MNNSLKWIVLIGTLVAGVLLYLLAPVLMPFLVAATLAYLGDPLVDRLERLKLSRTLAVSLVFLMLVLMLTVVVLLLIPVLEQQITALVNNWPRYIDWVQATLVQLTQTLGLDARMLNLEQLKQAVAKHWQDAGGLVATLLSSASQSGLVLLGWLANIVLIPVVTFYLLRDWDVMVAAVRELLPRRYEATVSRLVGESDQVLSAFLRGQLSVMAVLTVLYSMGLWLVGLDVAFLIALIAGLVSFVPYLGFITGISLASLAAWMQFQDWVPLIWIALIFGVGQLLEGFWLTPKLVGEKIGLHPVAVIFAVMAGGQLFGFVGVLLALPVAAVCIVLLREAHRRYLASHLYTPPNLP